MADYTTTTWVDDDGSTTVGTALNATRLNKIEAGVQDAAQHNKTGLLSARPAVASGNKGWTYLATDTGALAVSDGSVWQSVPATTGSFSSLVTFSGTGKTALSFSDTTTTTGLTIGADTNLYRLAANTLKTDGSLTVGGAVTLSGAGNNIQLAADGQYIVAAASTSATSQFLYLRAAADSQYRLNIDYSGKLVWGSGSATGDTNLYRSAATTLTTDSDFTLATAGKGLRVKEGSNAKQGTATLTSGTVTVSNTSVTANSRIFLTGQASTVTGALRVNARTAGTSFVITSSVAGDSGVVAYQIFEPA